MKTHRSTLTVCLLAFFSVMTARLAFSPVVPAITEYFGVSNGDVGLALTGMWAAYAAFQYPSGILGDRFGERRVILSALALLVATTLLVAVAPVFWLFLLFVVLLGASAGLYYTVATSLLTKLFENTGRAIGIHGAGGPLAGLVTPSIVAWLATRYSWRIGILVAVAVAVPVLVGAVSLVPKLSPERPDEPLGDRLSFAPATAILRRPSLAFVTSLSALGWFAFQATISFLPAFLVAYHEISVPTASVAFSAYFAILGGGMIASGDLSEWFGRDRVLTVELLAGAVGYCLLVLTDDIVTIGAGIALVGVAMAWPVPMEARLMDTLTDEERGTAFGLVRSIYMSVGALGSFVVGTAADNFGWDVAVSLLAAVVVVAFLGILGNRLFHVRL